MKYAYFSLLLNTAKIEEYVNSLIVLAKTLQVCRNNNTHINCILEKGIDEKYARRLKPYFDNVFFEDSIIIKGKFVHYITTVRWKKADMYNAWIARIMTKFSILKYTQYDKVLFLDADILSVTNWKTKSCQTNKIFENQTPAGILSLPRELNNVKVKSNTVINKKLVIQSLKGFGMIGGIYLLEPSMATYNKLIKFINNEKVIEWIDKRINKIVAGPDEILITLFYRNKWHQLPENTIAQKWKDYTSKLFYHMNNTKPWELKQYINSFPDVALWHEIAKN